MRRGLVSLLTLGAVVGATGTLASSVWGQDEAPAASAAPAAASSAPAPAASAPTPPTPTPAAEESVPETGWELAARVSFSLPTGDLNGELLGALPLQIDAGRRFSRQLILGVYGYAAVVFPVSGAGFAFGFGAEGQYFLSEKILGLIPWFGVQGGYLVGSLSGGGSSTGVSGPEGGVQAGLDYKKGFGPFAAFTVGSYSGAGGGGGGSTGGGGSGGSQTGEWVTIGMRSTFDW